MAHKTFTGNCKHCIVWTGFKSNNIYVGRNSLYLYFFAKCNFLRGQAFECVCVTTGIPQFYVNYWFIIISAERFTVHLDSSKSRN